MALGPPTRDVRPAPLRRSGWLLPWGGSLALHLLLALAVTAVLDRPRDVVWVDLADIRLVTVPRTGTPVAVAHAPQPRPATAAHPQPRPIPAPSRETAAPEPTDPAGISPAPAATRSSAPTSTGSAGSAGSDGTPAPRLPAAAPDAVPPPGAAPAESYRREQFAYIRERVMQRLSYPPMARRQGWQGEVRVAFIVRTDGSLGDLRVVHGSGHLPLDRQALRAVEGAAPFPPPPAPVAISLPVLFSLDAPRP